MNVSLIMVRTKTDRGISMTHKNYRMGQDKKSNIHRTWTLGMIVSLLLFVWLVVPGCGQGNNNSNQEATAQTDASNNDDGGANTPEAQADETSTTDESPVETNNPTEKPVSQPDDGTQPPDTGDTPSCEQLCTKLTTQCTQIAKQLTRTQCVQFCESNTWGQYAWQCISSASSCDSIIGKCIPAFQWTLQQVQQAQSRKAVCNDGTPAAYFVRRATNPEFKDKWIIHLQGGGSCRTIDDCNQRKKNSPGLMTGRKGTATFTSDGIYSSSPSKNPDFYQYNWVWILYCSSDGWIGDREASKETGGYHFRGRNIVKAVIEDLSATNNKEVKPLKDSSNLLLTGGSAGAAGVRNLIDVVAELLPNVKVKGLADAAWRLNQPAYGLDWTQTDTEAKRSYTFWGAPFPKTCAANEKTAERCALSEVMMRHTKTPLFHANDQKDSTALKNAGIPTTDKAGRENYAKSIRTELSRLQGAFSSNRGAHTLCFKSQYMSLKVKGVTFQQVFTNWYFERQGPTSVIAEP